MKLVLLVLIARLARPKIKTYSRYDNEIAALLYFTISSS